MLPNPAHMNIVCSILLQGDQLIPSWYGQETLPMTAALTCNPAENPTSIPQFWSSLATLTVIHLFSTELLLLETYHLHFNISGVAISYVFHIPACKHFHRSSQAQVIRSIVMTSSKTVGQSANNNCFQRLACMGI